MLKQISSPDHVMDQILWNNRHLLIDGKPQFCKKSYMAGIVKIKDILLPNGKLKPWDFSREKGLNLINYFLIFGLTKALPDSWRVSVNSGYIKVNQTAVLYKANKVLGNFILCSKTLINRQFLFILVRF